MYEKISIYIKSPPLPFYNSSTSPFSDYSLFAFIGLSGTGVLSLLSDVFSDDSFFIAIASRGLVGLVTLLITLFQIENTHFHINGQWHVLWFYSGSGRH